MPFIHSEDSHRGKFRGRWQDDVGGGENLFDREKL